MKIIKLLKTLILILVVSLYFPQALSLSQQTSPQPDLSYESYPKEKEEPKYVAGELIVKLKPGKTLEELEGLNTKYKVTSIDKVFKETASPQDTLKQLQDKLAKLDAEHQNWYWQLDKDSQEYKDYIAKIEKEKEELRKQIKAQEDLISHLEQRQKRAPSGTTTPDLNNIYILNTDTQTNIALMAQDYSGHPSVEYAEPNYIVKVQAFPQTLPNDTYVDPDQDGTWSTGAWGQTYEDMWGLKKIQADKAWPISQGSGVIVAVVDTGIDYNHEDISANIWTNLAEIPNNNIDDDGNGYIDDVRGWDFVGKYYYNPQQDNDPMDGYGHGTHVAGTIAAVGNNSKGIIGVAPQTKVMTVKGLDDSGYGYDSDLANCLKYAADNGADVINNSWGGSGASKTIEDTINYAYTKGCVVVVAAGNEGVDSSFFYPANISNVITVGASSQRDTLCGFSNRGAKIDVVAPGGTDYGDVYNILSLLAKDSYLSRYYGSYIIGSNYIRLGGTSMACPHVAGVAALILAKNPTFNPEQIRYILRNSTDDIESGGWDYSTAYGRINAYKAVTFSQVPPKLYATITSPFVGFPSPENFYNKEKIAIKGSANGDDFNSYKLEYAKYSDSGNLSFNTITTNITKISDGMLGEFDASNLDDGKYFVRANVYTSSDLYLSSTITLYVDKTLKTGWPKLVSYWKSIPPSFRSRTAKQSLTFADLDNDGYKEVLTTEDNRIFVWRYDGSTFHNNFPVVLSGANTYPPPFESPPPVIATADLNNDGKMEIIVGAEVSPSLAGPIYAFHNDGASVTGFPSGKPDPNIPSYVTRLVPEYSPVVTDLEGDGKKEIIAILGTYNSNYPRLYMIALNSDGTMKQGWPIILSQELYGASGLASSIAIADLDNDTKKEIIIVIRPSNIDKRVFLNIYAYDGSIQKQIELDSDKGVSPHLIVGDCNRDGKLEILIVLFSGNDRYLYLLDNEGKILPGWYQGIKGTSEHSYIFADMDGDSDLEILAIGGLYWTDLYGFHHTGSSLGGDWPKKILTGSTDNFWFSPMVIGNIQKSPKFTALFISADKWGLYGVDSEGKVLTNWPKDIPATDAACAVGDLDKDGIIEIGVHSLDGMVYIWQEETPSGKEIPSFWSTLYGNNSRTNVYGYDTTPPTTPIVTDEGMYTSNNVSLTASWSSSDPESGISEYQYRITQDSTSGTVIKDWTSTGTTPSVTVTGLSLQTDTSYYFGVKTKNGAGIWSNEGYSDGITVDSSLPTTPVVWDQGNYTGSLDKLTASWSSSDSESGVIEYLYAIGRTKGGTDIVGWTSTGTSTSITKTGLTLQNGKTYYFSVKAKNGAGLWSSVGYSDGIKVDNTPPTTPVVTDEGTHTASNTTLTASWSSSDSESGITEYYYAIGTSKGGTDVVPWVYMSIYTGITNSQLNLIKGKTYYFSVKAKNVVGLESIGYSDGITANYTSNSVFVSQIVPTSMVIGKYYTVTIIMKNAGTSIWTKAGNFKLGSQNPQDNLLWGIGRVKLGTTERIYPGQTKTFSFTVKAPSKPGTYNFQWRMLQENVEWFGAYSTNATVNVK